VGKDSKDKFSAQLKDAGVPAEVSVLTPACDKVARINTIRKLLAYNMDVVVVFGTCAAQDTAEATTKVPVVLLGGYDPTGGKGDRPSWMGPNVAAVACKSSIPFLYDKMNKTAKLTAVGVAQCSDDPDAVAQLKDIRTEAANRGFEVIVADATKLSVEQMARTFAPAQFVHLGWSCTPDALDVDFKKLGKPLVTQTAGVAGPGVVFSLAVSSEAMMAEGAKIVSRILGGEKPGDLPINTVQKPEFLVNLEEALGLGLKIPFDVIQARP
jgi:putative ABC transport system substrate-binding protein